MSFWFDILQLFILLAICVSHKLDLPLEVDSLPSLHLSLTYVSLILQLQTSLYYPEISLIIFHPGHALR